MPVDDAVKGEIATFMERAWQVSFGYFAAVALLAAGTDLDAASAVAAWFRTSLGVLFASAIIITNVVYLTIACACLCGVLKRGYFILSDPSQEEHRSWERFARVQPRGQTSKHGKAVKFRGPEWNLDNYFMLPIFALILGASVGATAYGFVQIDVVGIKWAFLVAAVGLHCIPLYAVWTMRRFEQLLRTADAQP